MKKERPKRQKIDTENWPEIAFFANAVATHRKLKGWSQKQLGEATGLDQAYISSLEGYWVNPTLQVQAILARCLGVSLNDLTSNVMIDVPEEPVDLRGIKLRHETEE